MEFEELKNLTVWELLTLLQNLIKENSEIIRKIKQVSLSKENEGKSESAFSNKSDAFKKATLQKSKYSELHHKLFSILKAIDEDLSNPESQNANGTSDLQEIEKIIEFEFQFCLEETINGAVQFNSAHHFFNNPEFIKSLIDEYSKKEEYEKCAVLLKRIKKLQ